MRGKHTKAKSKSRRVDVDVGTKSPMSTSNPQADADADADAGEREYANRLKQTLSKEWKLDPTIERRLSQGEQRMESTNMATPVHNRQHPRPSPSTPVGMQIPRGGMHKKNSSEYHPLSSHGSVSPAKGGLLLSKGSNNSDTSSKGSRGRTSFDSHRSGTKTCKIKMLCV